MGVVRGETAVFGAFESAGRIGDPDETWLDHHNDVGRAAVLGGIAKIGVRERLAGEDLVDDLACRKRDQGNRV
jgi:hypothetical protein